MATITFSRKALRHGSDKVAFTDWGDMVTFVTKLVTLVNELKTNLNAVNAKLDSDAGITDTDYASLHDVAAADADTMAIKS